MADTFKLWNQRLGTSNTVVYTCPAGANAIVILGQIANIDGSNSVDAWIYATDSSAANTRALGWKIPVPAAAATTFLTGKLVLESGDYISANCSSANMIDVTVSVLEIT